MALEKQTSVRNPSANIQIEQSLLPYSQIKDEFMTFFAFHGIILGTFLSYIGYKQFFEPGCSSFFPLVPDWLKLMNQWNNFAFFKSLAKIGLLLAPVTCLWISIHMALGTLPLAPEERSFDNSIMIGRVLVILMFFVIGGIAGIWLSMCVTNWVAVLFFIVFFLLNASFLGFLILKGMTGRRESL